MRTLTKIIWTLTSVTICVTTSYTQPSDNKINRRWELNSIESLTGGIGGIGDEMRKRDLTNKAQLIFEGDGQSDTV